MRYKYITKIEIKFDKKKTFKRKSIKYLQNYIFQESVKLPGDDGIDVAKWCAEDTGDVNALLYREVQNILDIIKYLYLPVFDTCI